MSGTTVGKVCLPRIRSGIEILAFRITEKCLKPWRRINVLGVERSGIVPIRVCDPDEGMTLIEAKTLDTSFPENGAQTNHVHFTDLDYNIQRLWDYDGLWEKDSNTLKLRLDETWVILDQNNNIAMLRKDYPETIPEGYKRGKIEPFNSDTLDTYKIKIPSLWEAVKTLNLLLESIKPTQNLIPLRLANSADTDPEPETLDHHVTSDIAPVISPAVISILRQSDNDAITEDEITASIIHKLKFGRNLIDTEVEYLKSDKFEIKNHKNRLNLIHEGIENKGGHNFEAWRYLGMSKTILTGLTQDELNKLNDYARKKSGYNDQFANGLADNNELKELLVEPKEPNPALSATV